MYQLRSNIDEIIKIDERIRNNKIKNLKPCILKIVVDRQTFGCIKPCVSKGHYYLLALQNSNNRLGNILS